MRRGELIALTWSDIDFADNTVPLRNETTKSGKGRVVAFDVATRVALRTIAVASVSVSWTVAMTSRRGPSGSGSPGTACSPPRASRRCFGVDRGSPT